VGEAAGGEAFRRRRIGTVPRAATRCSAKSSCTSAGVSRLGAEGCCSVAYQEDVAVGPGPAKPSERRQSPIRAEAIPSDPKSLMKYCSQVLTTARVLLGWNPCSKGMIVDSVWRIDGREDLPSQRNSRPAPCPSSAANARGARSTAA